MAEQNTKLEILETTWVDLEPHHKRDALFLISPEVGLQNAAEAIAADQGNVIAAWLHSQHIARPNDAHVAALGKCEKLRFAIVQPYVLVEFEARIDAKPKGIQ